MEAVIILAILGVVLGVILGLADKFLKVEIDSRVEQISSMLPQFNCGACGFPGCMGLAEAIVAQEGRVSACTPLKADAAQEIYQYIEEAEGPNGEKLDINKIK